MIAALARRLGFSPGVPAALVDDWIVPSAPSVPVELAPREGRASVLVDQFGRLEVIGAGWTLDWSLAAGARWVPASSAERSRQRLLAPAVIETQVETPSGPVIQRVAAAVVGGRPVAIVEIENAGGVAVAAGLVVRPLVLAGRGHIGRVAVNTEHIAVNGTPVVRFLAPPATVAAFAGRDGDLLAHLPAAEDRQAEASVQCRSGGAQAAAVWPVPHTAVTRFVVELNPDGNLAGDVPTVADVNRGWETHARAGLQVDVAEEVAEPLLVATRTLLSGWPSRANACEMLVALAESGFAREGIRLLDMIEHTDDDATLLRSVARWWQLSPQHGERELEALVSVIGPVARSAHVVANAGAAVRGERWLPAALASLAAGLDQIDQPEVGARVASFAVVSGSDEVAETESLAQWLADLESSYGPRGWTGEPPEAVHHAAAFISAVRAAMVMDHGDGIEILPVVPSTWRGRPMQVLNVPVGPGTLSFGLRWHGPRPALLWEVTGRDGEIGAEPLRITVPGIDPDFVTSEASGETLLADPGWPQP